MLVPNANMVVMRRFSPKEDKRRITAAAYVAGTLPGPVVGLENHTNYLWRPGGALSVDEARGLAAFLSSEVVDSYLRSVAGSTQVNAADLRALPLPPLPMILAIGRSLGNDASLATADAAVAAILCADMPYAEAV
jgi:adenine-specific DNA-methyltransferase